MFRNLTNEKAKKFKKKQKEVFLECLVDPGPDLVICDEGHILKNTKSALNIAMNRIKTRRRIILTGTPLQNNLSEYFAMVDFVKPKLLGTFNEFRNRFVNPITNGQSLDSTDRDVRVMKKRAFILNDLLKGNYMWHFSYSNDKLCCLFTKRFRAFILFTENNQILLKISVIPILFTFIYLVALNFLVNNQLNSSLPQIIITIIFKGG